MTAGDPEEEEEPPKTIHELALCGDVETLKSLLGATKKDERATVVAERNERGQSPLEIAATWGHIEFVDAVLGVGAEVTQANSRGYTALHRAAMWGRVECVAKLARQQTPEGPVDLELRTLPSTEHPQGETAAEVATRYKQDAAAAEIAAVLQERIEEEARLQAEAEAKQRKNSKKKK